MAATSTDSAKNCTTICPRSAPTTLRTPISLARWVARAVARFMKLMHASARMNTAIAANVRTALALPGVLISASLCE
jgi:hypothetical protein